MAVDRTDGLESAIDRWGQWLDEFEAHPLDQFEFAGMAEARDRAGELLEIFCRTDAAANLDAVDARFERLTVIDPERADLYRGRGWWWARVPMDPTALSYFRGEQ